MCVQKEISVNKELIKMIQKAVEKYFDKENKKDL